MPYRRRPCQRFSS